MGKETILLKELKALTDQILQHFTNDSLNLMRQFVALEQRVNECLKDQSADHQPEMPLVKTKEDTIASPPAKPIPPLKEPVLTTDVFDEP